MQGMRRIAFSEKHPELLSEWSSRNEITPNQLSFGSNKKVWWIGKCGHEWLACIQNRSRGNGCPYCGSRALLKGFNDLATVRPDLAAEWSDRNLPLTPDQVMPNCNRKVYWRCEKGHEWKATVCARNKGYGCGICTHQTLAVGVNDFATRFPKLAAEWSEKNTIRPTDVKGGFTSLNIWWTCPDCHMDWKGNLENRVSCGSTCPICRGRKIIIGYNDLATTDPEVASEWDDDKNALPITEVIRTSKREFWWKCAYGHHWYARVYDRTVQKHLCPKCETRILARVFAAYAHLPVETDTILEGSIKIDIFFPSLHIAIQTERTKAQGIRWQEHIKALCEEKGLRYLLLPPDIAGLNAAAAFLELMSKIGISVQVSADELFTEARALSLQGETVKKVENKEGDLSL